MSEMMLETRLVGNLSGQFFVPSYQRGYRWMEGVIRLLDDFIGDKYIILINSSYLVFDIDTDKNIEKVSISQNADGIDVEDKIIKMRKYLEDHALA